MTRYVNRIFENTTVTLDGNEYIDCIISNCTIRYGGGLATLNCTDFQQVLWDFYGPAARTIQMLQHMSKAPGDESAKRKVLSLFLPPTASPSPQPPTEQG